MLTLPKLLLKKPRRQQRPRLARLRRLNLRSPRNSLLTKELSWNDWMQLLHLLAVSSLACLYILLYMYLLTFLCWLTCFFAMQQINSEKLWNFTLNVPKILCWTRLTSWNWTGGLFEISSSGLTMYFLACSSGYSRGRRMGCLSAISGSWLKHSTPWKTLCFRWSFHSWNRVSKGRSLSPNRMARRWTGRGLDPLMLDLQWRWRSSSRRWRSTHPNSCLWFFLRRRLRLLRRQLMCLHRAHLFLRIPRLLRWRSLLPAPLDSTLCNSPFDVTPNFNLWSCCVQCLVNALYLGFMHFRMPCF
jgi:hypothetical protein